MTHDLVYVVGQLTAGGQERQLSWLLRGLVGRGVRPAVVVWNLAESDEFLPAIRALGVPVVGMDRRLSAPNKLLRMRSLARAWDARVVHSYGFYTNFAAHFAASRGMVAVGSIRSDFSFAQAGAGATLGRLSARWPRAMICNSESTRDQLRRQRRFFGPRRVHVVRNGLDLETYPPHADRPARPHAIGIGRLVAVKRWDVFLGAAECLRRRGLPVEFTIAGDGPLRPELQAESRRRGLEGVVHFGGYDGDVPGLISRSSLLILSSDSEGCPNVVMEAMACGRAVVATDVGDARRLVQEGRTGFVVPRGDAEGLADRVARLVEDPCLCRRMGEAGRERAEREFGLDRLVDETLAVYRSEGWRG